MDLSSLVVGVVGLVALVMKFIDFLRLVTNLPGERKSVLTQLSVWVAGIGAVFLYSASDFGPTIVIGDILLNDMSSATKIILGLAIGSAASVGVDFKKAVDTSDSARVPKLGI